MDQYRMTANFRPTEPKNGHIGFADLTIADAFTIRGISVFENEKSGLHIQFPGFGEGQDRHDYVVPLSADARAQFVDVIKMAVQDQEHHFGHVTGRQDPFLKVTGKTVQEPYADGRFSVQVGDLCALHGITTRELEGEKGKFVAVNWPQGEAYEKDGKTEYPDLIFPRKDGKVYNKQTKAEEHKDYRALVHNLVRSERKKAMEKKTSLSDQISNASAKAAQASKGQEGPAKEAER